MAGLSLVHYPARFIFGESDIPPLERERRREEEREERRGEILGWMDGVGGAL